MKVITVKSWGGFNCFSVREFSSGIDWFAYHPKLKLLAVTFLKNLECETYLYRIDGNQLKSFILKADENNSWGKAYAGCAIQAEYIKNPDKCKTPTGGNGFSDNNFNYDGELDEFGLPADVVAFYEWMSSPAVHTKKATKTQIRDLIIVDPTFAGEYSF